MEQSLETGYDLLYLAACALHRSPADPERVGKMDLDAVYAAARNQSLEAICCMALEDLPEFDGPLAQKWKSHRDRAVRKNVLFAIERQALEDWMEETGIWYLPLKGCVLEPMYPRPGMRQMSDNDILYDETFQLQVRDWFVDRDYHPVSVGVGKDDVYTKEPVLNFEMHHALFNAEVFPELERYWSHTERSALPVPGRKFGLQMTNENFYLFLLCHGYKHFLWAGTGVRILLDMKVFLDRFGPEMDREFLQGELQKLGLADFEAQLRNLKEVIFDAPVFDSKVLTEDQRRLLDYMFGSGTYGTHEGFLQNKLFKFQGSREPVTTQTRLRYYFRRLIPDESYYDSRDDLRDLKNHPLQRQVYLTKRLYRAVFVNSKRILREMRDISRV